MLGFGRTPTMVAPEAALPGRDTPLPGIPDRHAVLGTPLRGPWQASARPAHVLYLAFGCFWGAERILWQLPGVITTAVGYQGGYTPNPTYQEVCTGRTGHTEAVLVSYDPEVLATGELLKVFWEHHDPTQGMRQGNDVGTQYRSAVYWTTPEQERLTRASAEAFAEVLGARTKAPLTTELRPAGPPAGVGATPGDDGHAGSFFYAEEYHQQYLHKNPGGYCMHGHNGLTCPVPS
ncbi:MAG: peptide-methionine (S)-S-oxide reductase MsrA [Austwickia sp.]|nr:peptide-methionine (S)-S-oxide reductase MsrA [Austwickia sp.]MBK8436151.1 peptide-methionine (S)-S-oxide reductase MsrA [Austwickia sp.]